MVSSVQVGRFRFDILLSNKKQAPLLRAAASDTLKSLPRPLLKKFLSPTQRYQISVSFLSAPEMKRLNNLYRQKNRPTDVLSFSSIEFRQIVPGPVARIGDVVLCEEVAKKQAKLQGCTVETELRRLVIHGILHLFGYDHEKSAREARKMFKLQEKILR